MPLRPIAFLFALLVGARHAHAQVRETLKTYHDPQYGVTFTYPSTWSASPNLDPFYLMTDILHPRPDDSGYEQALMKVSFKNNTLDHGRPILDGVEFVYFVLPQITAAVCYARIRDLADPSQGDRSPANVVIHGITYLHLSTGDAGLNHQARRELYAAYLGTRCYLFEAGIHSHNGGNPAFLLSTQNETVKLQLPAIMQSVRINAQAHQ
jgi:hypothetical protein